MKDIEYQKSNKEIATENYLTFFYMLYKKELKPIHDIVRSREELENITNMAIKAYMEDPFFHSFYDRNLELAEEAIKERKKY